MVHHVQGEGLSRCQVLHRPFCDGLMHVAAGGELVHVGQTIPICVERHVRSQIEDALASVPIVAEHAVDTVCHLVDIALQGVVVLQFASDNDYNALGRHLA